MRKSLFLKWNLQTLVLVAAMFIAQVNFVYAAELEPVVTVETGALRGEVVNGIECFKGIPYAAPPIGELRWQPPQAPAKWTGIRDAKVYGSEAAQNGDLGVFANAGGKEDCLYLNVFVDHKALQEAKKANRQLPVFAWIHGGALNVGAGSDYNPTALAKDGKAVVVTINYRLGVLGFFAHPAIDKENHARGNYGLMDQDMALSWIQKNIAQFGGNPKNVTIAGESSGGQSVLAQMTNPKAAGKFQQAISMSGNTITLHSNFTCYSMETAEQKGIALAEAAGYKNATAEQLRNLSTAEILKVQTPYLLTTFIVDGEYVPEHIGDALAAGRFNKVTLINGLNRNEGSFFAGLRENLSGKIMDKADYMAALQWFCNDMGKGDNLAERIMKEYPIENYSSYAEAYAAVVTDAWFAATADNLQRSIYDKIPVYAYEFNDQSAPAYLSTSFRQGAAHTYEMPYIFPGFNGSSKLSTELNPVQQKLSDEMVQLWAHASEIGENTKWQPYTPDKGNYLQFTLPQAKMTEHEFARIHHIDFWDKVGRDSKCGKL